MQISRSDIIWTLVCLVLTNLIGNACSSGLVSSDGKWTTVWTAMPQLTEPANLPSGIFNATPKFFNTTIRQSFKLDLPASGNSNVSLRLRISNAFGTTPLLVTSVSVARPFNNSAGSSLIQDGTDVQLTFNKGNDPGVRIPNGALAVSDSFSFNVACIDSYQSNSTIGKGSIITVTLYLAEGQTGDAITSHPGGRINSYLAHGNQRSALNITGADVQQLAHWYFISAVEAWTPASASTFVVIGDSITDGRGSDTDLNDRWPDYVFTRLQAQESTNGITIANQAAGGNRILNDGLGPSALSRIDRDVLAQSGVKCAMIFEGVNDIGTADTDTVSQAQVYHDLIAAYRQIIERIHAQGIPFLGATITPFGNVNTTLQPYSDPMRESTRIAVNDWIRNSGEFDGVIDFDTVVRDPNNSSMLAAQFDSGDGLHPNILGYQAMANAFPVELLQQFCVIQGD